MNFPAFSSTYFQISSLCKRKTYFFGPFIKKRFSEMAAFDNNNGNNNDTVKFGEKTGSSNKRNFLDYANVPSDTAPNEVYLQVIQSGCPGVEKCLYLFTTGKRYLIGCPENTSKLVAIAGSRYIDLNSVFITQSKWSNTGGLPGFGISKRQQTMQFLYNSKAKNQQASIEVNLHGPQDINLIFLATKAMYEDDVLPIKLVGQPYTLGRYEDNAFLIDYVPLFGRKKEMLDSNYVDKHDDNCGPYLKRGYPMPATPQDVYDLSVGYIFRLKSKPGRLNAKKCFDMGVPVGPILGDLVRGNDVTLADGRTVRSKDVVMAPEKPPVFAVVDVNDELMLESLTKSEKFDEFFVDCESESKLDLLVHFTNSTIFETDSYKSWMQKFGAKTRHLILNDKAPYMPHNEGVFRVQSWLNDANPNMFPLLQCHSFEQPKADITDARTVYAEPLMKYYLRPNKQFLRNDSELFDYRAIISKLNQNSNYVEAKAEYHRQLKEFSHKDGPKYPEVMFAGTGSASPTKTRNTAGILLNINEDSSILFDCGENTYHQLFEFYGPKDVLKILCNIKLIFISHLHPDHHFGLFTVMIKRREAFETLGLNFDPVYMLAPGPIYRMQSEYSVLVEDLIPLAKRMYADLRDHAALRRRLIEVEHRLRIKLLTLVKVLHPKLAHGLVVQLLDGTKIVYSGDTRPCHDFVEPGFRADLLIHEATFEDGLSKEAEIKCHSTVSDAIKIADEIQAKYTLLTHFSARYSKLPIVDESVVKRGDVGIAFDFMRTSFSQLDTMSKVIPVLQHAFDEAHQENVERRDKRKAREYRDDYLKQRLKIENEKTRNLRSDIN